MSFTPLTTGCLSTIMRGETLEEKEPILQVLGTKKINSSGGAERYRLLLSDGKFLQSFAMLSTQLNPHVTNGDLSEFTIIRVKNHITSVVNKTDNDEKRVLIIISLEVLHKGEEVNRKIGEPVSLSDSSKGETGIKTEAVKTEPAATTNQARQSTSNASRSHQNSSSANESIFDNRATHPITSLSPYQNKWVIKARVTSKSDIRHWSNAKGEGKLFSMDLMDESGEIRCTGFRDAVDKFYDLIQIDKVYYISKAQLKPANKQFTSIKNDYEMTITNDTVIQECTEADDIPVVQYNFVPISEITTLETNATVDIIGVCRDFSELNSFTARATGRELKKRELTLVDQSNSAVTLTLWGKEAENFNDYGQPVILVKNARVSEFNGGKSFTMGSGAVLKINPDCTEGHRLRGWFDNGGGEGISNNLSARTGAGTSFAADWLTFHEAKIKNLGNGDKPDYYQLKGIVHIVKSNNAIYKACPQADCNKKVIDMENGHYRCEKCSNEYPNFKYRLMLSMSIGDWTSNRWVTCFADVAEGILNKSSQEIGEAFDRSKEEGEAILSAIHFKSFVFKLRTKVEYYGDSARNKVIVQSATAVNYKDYNDYLIKNIQRLTGIGKAN